LQKFLLATVTVSTLLGATSAFAQLGAGYEPHLYGTKAFDTARQPSPSMTSRQKAPDRSQLETESLSGTTTPEQSRQTGG